MIKFDFSNPEDWTFKAATILVDVSEENAENVEFIIDDILDANGGGYDDVYGYEATREMATPDSRFKSKGTCDHCGAHFNYGAIFENDQGQVAVVGGTCATNKLNLTQHQYAVKRAKELKQRAKSKALGDARENKLSSYRRAALNADHYISKDLCSKFRKYGSLSLKQWALARKLYLESTVTEYEPPMTDVVTGNGITITGKIATVKYVDGWYGVEVKMLVIDDRNFKVWGTFPAKLEDAGADKGTRIEMVANVEVSKDDKSFGFFKRPRKVVILEEI